MQYLGFKFILKNNENFQNDLLIDDLANLGFDSFENHENGFDAYILQQNFQQNKFEELCYEYQKTCLENVSDITIEHKNWNEEWEKNFAPIIVSDQCYIRASFHPEKKEYPYQIIIDPKMSFGTGHHQTTSSMMALMLDCSFKDKTVLDMGCGTGILAILAHQLGAQKVTAIDYDEICTENTLENFKLNQISNYKIITGGKEVIPENTFYDIILANINRNILIDQIEIYAKQLNKNGILLMSGFYYENDLEIIENYCNKYALNKITYKTKDEWVAVKFQKTEKNL